MEQDIKAELINFIVTNYLFGDESRTPAETDSLVDDGVIDSTGILELIEFLEAQFGIEVTEAETIPKNLDSVSNLTRFVSSKRLTSAVA